MTKKLVCPADLPSYGIQVGNDARKNLEAAGQFPKRVWVTERTHAYVEAELLAYVEQKIAERDAKTGAA